MQNPTTNLPGFVYAIQSEETLLIKIGYSAEPENRIRNMQTGSAARLTLLICWPGTIGDEQAIHRAFASDRIQGEWFRPSPAVLTFLLGFALGVPASIPIAKDDVALLKAACPQLPTGYWWDVARNGKGFIVKLKWRENQKQKTQSFPRISRDTWNLWANTSRVNSRDMLRRWVIGSAPDKAGLFT